MMEQEPTAGESSTWLGKGKLASEPGALAWERSVGEMEHRWHI